MNITLRIPDELGLLIKHYAVDEDKSISQIVVDFFKEKVGFWQSSSYREAQKDAWSLIEQGIHGRGKKFVREEVYDR